jgi:sugar porter (SP) family MFS transporter
MPGGAAAAGPVTFASPEGKSKLPGILMASFAAFGGFLFGYDTGYISGVKAMPYWLQLFGTNGKLETSNDSLVTSILSAGTFFGALFAYPVGDFLGRRLGIVFACLVFSVGVALQTAATAIPVFTVGRVFAGLGVGLVSCLVPMYQSETAPKWIRGGVVACYQWAITIGLLVAAIVVNATKDIDDERCYRIPIGIQFIWAAILSGGIYTLPESPRYLILKGRDDEARRALGRLLSTEPDSEEVQAEFTDIAGALETERAIGATSYLDCFRSGQGRNGLRTWTGIILQALQQLTGINFIFYYGTTFFMRSGITNSFIITIATNVVNVGMTVPGIWAVDKVGRRSLLIIGAVVMCVCEFIVAIVGVTVSVTNQSGQKVLIAFVCIYIGAFAATWGPIAWVVVGEIFPLAIRAKSMSMATASNWLWNFAIGYSTPYLVDEGAGKAGLGAKVFFIWGGCCFLCLAFTYFFIPETKGLSLEQVDLLYQNSSIIGSNQYRRQLIAEGQNNEAVQANRQAYRTVSRTHEEKLAEKAEHV